MLRESILVRVGGHHAACCCACRVLTDVWSFGILLWQLVSGEDVPFRHLTVHEIAAGVSLGLVSDTPWHAQRVQACEQRRVRMVTPYSAALGSGVCNNCKRLHSLWHPRRPFEV